MKQSLYDWRQAPLPDRTTGRVAAIPCRASLRTTEPSLLRSPPTFVLTAILACVLNGSGLTGCAAPPPQTPAAEQLPLVLAPASLVGIRDERARFRGLLCSEREGEKIPPEACDATLRRLRGEGEPLPDMDTSQLPREHYTIAVAYGVGWDCVRSFIDESTLPTVALQAAGYQTRLLEVEGLSSSTRNAKLIADALTGSNAPEGKLILVGYSKGLPDILEALDRYPQLAQRTAALLSVAGSVGGSPIADNTADASIGLLRLSPFGSCVKGDGEVMQSLHSARRHAWLADHLPLPVPSYSLITAPEPDRVSTALRSSYELLGRVHPLNDGAVLHYDQLLPFSTLLGYANADHWAVAVPVTFADVPLADILVSGNNYPRSRLWRSAIDFIVADIEKRE